MLAGTAAVALVTGTSGAASAAGSTLFLSDTDGRSLGTMTHLDPDPDTSRVCDTRADGHGVTGKLYTYIGGWQLRETQADGGDAGCDYFDYNVVSSTSKYLMKICWNGPGEICAKKEFTED
ncbi:hypothetical protein [Streptomyces sp. NPDC014623]|uniref:hypothetical protein n=1 Tax=Streptomyces sp. NPDC014623 TaxID=3364875 RepID=UPI0036F873A5